MPDDALKALQLRIGYRFRTIAYLHEALTHPSVLLAPQAPEGLKDYERLEFLGDAVLSLILAEVLFRRLPQAQEGTLAQARSVLNQRSVLSALAQELRLGEVLRFSPEEAQSGGAERNSILEDALEALIGAIYLDSDFSVVSSVVLTWYGDIPNGIDLLLQDYNPKGKLQERIQLQNPGAKLLYSLDRTDGPGHARVFCVSLYLDGTLLAQAQGSSKKYAEEAAARKALASGGWQNGCAG